MFQNASRALALVAVLATVRASVAAEDDADVVVRKWLVLAPVDVAARRPLQPNAVFAKYLLDRTAAPPKEGEEVVGTLGKTAKWVAHQAAASEDKTEDGFVDAEGIGWAYASVESATDRVAIAKLEGAGVLFVGGAGFTGDVYQLGDAGVPVALKKGANDVFVGGTRGGFRLTLMKVGDDIDIGQAVSADFVEGQRRDQPLSIGRLLNPTTSPKRVLGVEMAPLGVRRAVLDPKTAVADIDYKPVPPKKPTDIHRRTFISNIDGSVQSYALVPPAPGDFDKTKIGLVLSLHGAGVECMKQAQSYAPKPDFWIVCPTNRGRFGFDWQDWGRLDAYEVLADALKVTGVDPRRVYLTGHSMGGHGTWHLAANDPDRFLAIAPSAGWSSFDSHGGSQAMSPLAWMWRAADGASRTLDLVGNLAPIPTYVLHGEKDDNVPLSEARLMVDAVTKVGGTPEFHVEPAMGHWWDKDPKAPGADCVDWPGIWELFRKTQPAEDEPKQFEFVTQNLDVLSRRHWVAIDEPIERGRPCRVSARWDEATGTGFITTENVRAMSWRPLSMTGLPTIPPFRCVVDGQRIPDRVVHLRRGPTGWAAQPDWTGEPRDFRTARRPTSFKHAFSTRFVLVYGTAGDDAENRELLEKARCDSEIWAYRANGDANLMSDAQFLAGDFAERNVIVYGNADTNKAWGAVFDDDCPIVAKRGAMTVGGTKHEGVVASAFVRPRRGSTVALAAAFADTGAAATRLFYCFPVFGSGFGIPDYVVFGPGYLKEMDGDVRAAGWFDYAWRMK